MISKILVIAVLCVTYTLAEAPRYQRFRQPLKRQFFARQEAPYPDSSQQGGEPASAYGPPSTPQSSYGPPSTTPSYQYGPPQSNGDPEITNESDTEFVGQPSRLTNFQQTLPTKKSPQKFSQRLELQQQVQQFPTPQVQRFPAQPVVAPIQPVFSSAYQLAAIQPEGSYYIQLPNGAIQRVNYLTQPSVVDNSVLAKLEFRPVAEVQTTVAEPQLFVNTLVQSHVSTDE